ncbi:hypothetical protein [Candidatus Entotheonella palauensis]|uniref:Uncharacterized protein n=1 Tax=Candidatus Entotheonella gemina TaxID=1429439 RepID=W4MBG8_9BACT|nr:hypothetical protein [Candidatus Entotheonella palauensis]ETX07699.1 MAG: hypothetical protein ETSY2_09645 [Candidatus Entotheonella gemina]
MTHENHQQLRLKAGDLNAAVRSLRSALQRDMEVIHTQRQSAIETNVSDEIQRLNKQRDQLSMDLVALEDQVATLERLARGGVRPGREADALVYIDKLAQAFRLAVDDIKTRARSSLLMLERLPAWEVESARASVADADAAAALLKRVLDG